MRYDSSLWNSFLTIFRTAAAEERFSAEDRELINKTISVMEEKFEIRDTSDAAVFNGILDMTNRILELYQKKFASLTPRETKELYLICQEQGWKAASTEEAEKALTKARKIREKKLKDEPKKELEQRILEAEQDLKQTEEEVEARRTAPERMLQEKRKAVEELKKELAEVES